MNKTWDFYARCCSSHGITMSCAQYRRTHFAEVRPCCSYDARLLEAGQKREQNA